MPVPVPLLALARAFVRGPVGAGSLGGHWIQFVAVGQEDKDKCSRLLLGLLSLFPVLDDLAAPDSARVALFGASRGGMMALEHVSSTHALLLATALREANRPFELQLLDGVDHGYTTPA